MPVQLDLDTKDLAKSYDEKNDAPFISGCMLVDKMQVALGDTVLDIGCGTGRLGRHVSKIIGDSGRYIGIDPMEERIKIAKEKNEHPNAVFRVGVAEDISSVEDSSIDVAYMNWVFHWVPGKEAALREIVRVLKPGGKAGITFSPKELNRNIGINKIIDGVLMKEPYSKAVCLDNTSYYLHSVTSTELIQLQTNAGLIVKDIQIKLDKRYFQSARDVIKFYEAGLFGNFLNHVPQSLREQAKADIEGEFQKYQTKDGLQFDYYTICSITQKGEMVPN